MSIHSPRSLTRILVASATLAGGAAPISCGNQRVEECQNDTGVCVDLALAQPDFATNVDAASAGGDMANPAGAEGGAGDFSVPAAPDLAMPPMNLPLCRDSGKDTDNDPINGVVVGDGLCDDGVTILRSEMYPGLGGQEGPRDPCPGTYSPLVHNANNGSFYFEGRFRVDCPTDGGTAPRYFIGPKEVGPSLDMSMLPDMQRLPDMQMPTDLSIPPDLQAKLADLYGDAANEMMMSLPDGGMSTDLARMSDLGMDSATPNDLVVADSAVAPDLGGADTAIPADQAAAADTAAPADQAAADLGVAADLGNTDSATDGGVSDGPGSN